jgi:signal peptidase
MLKRICNILSMVLLVIMLIVAGIMLLPYAFGYQTLAVLSGSMEPVYPVGSIVFVQKVPAEEIKVGDPITFRVSNDGTYATHRVVRIDSDQKQFITKGDANDVEDGPTDFANFVGRASNYSVPWLGYISIYIKTPIGIMAMTGVAVVMILLTFLPEIFTKEKESTENRESQEPQTT